MRNVRLHKSGRYEARKQIQNQPFSGWGSSPNEALLDLEDRILRSANLRDIYSLKQWMEERYLPSIETTSKRHREKAEWSIKHLGRLGELPIIEVDRSRFQALFNAKAKTLKPETLKTLRSVWSAALNLAEADDIIQKNPLRFVKLPRNPVVQKPVLSASELFKLIQHSRGYAAHPIVLLAGLMGLRVGEIAGLKPEHFKVEGKLLVPGTKSQASLREIPLHPRVLAELAGFTFPLCGHRGSSRNALLRASYRAQMPDVNPHLLRHTFSSLLEWLGCPIDIRSRLLGHGKRSITQRYSHAEWENFVKWQTALVEFVYRPVGYEVGVGSNGDPKS